MARAQDEMTAHIRNLENNYQNVLNEMVNFQRNMAQQDGLMQNLIQYFLQLENGGQFGSSLSPSSLSSSATTVNNSSANRMDLDAMMLDSVATALPSPLTASSVNAAALLSLQAAVAANSMMNANRLVAL